MRGEWYGSHRAQIIDPVELRLVSGEIVPRHEQVNGIGRSGTQRVCELAANPGGGRRRWKGIGVADLCETDVTFDVFGELDGIACVSRLIVRTQMIHTRATQNELTHERLRGYVELLAWFA